MPGVLEGDLFGVLNVKFPPAHAETNPAWHSAISLLSPAAQCSFASFPRRPSSSWATAPSSWCGWTRVGPARGERAGYEGAGAHAGLAQPPGGRKWATEVQAVDGDDPNRSKTFHASEGDMPTETSETAKASEEATCLTCPCTKSIHSADCCWICSKDCWSIGKLSGPLLVLGWRPSRSSCRSGLGSARGSEAEEQKKEPGNPLTEPMLK